MNTFAVAALSACLALTTAAPAGAFERLTSVQPKIGVEFPAFTLPDSEGREVSLEDFRGKVILLSFWSCYTDTCFSSVSIIERLIF